MTRHYPVYDICLVCGEINGDKQNGFQPIPISRKNLEKYILNIESNNFYPHERNENETEIAYLRRSMIITMMPGSLSNIFRCKKCNLVYFHFIYDLSIELKTQILNGIFFNEFQNFGLATIHNWELMAKILIIENYPPSAIAKAFLHTLQNCKYNQTRKEHITNQLEKFLLKMISEDKKDLDIDKNVSYAILGEAYRRIELFDKSIEYFSKVQRNFPNNIVKRQLELAFNKDSSVTVKIHPLDPLRDIWNELLN